jgi:hypothetical protein
LSVTRATWWTRRSPSTGQSPTSGEVQAGRIQHLLDSIVDEFAENEDLPNTTNPDDWVRISGKKGERIVYNRTLVTGKSSSASRAIDTESNLGRYL